MKHASTPRAIGLGILLALVAAGQGAANSHLPAGHGGAMSSGHGMHNHGAAGAVHDMVTMPGLRGLNASPEESAEIETMFRNFRTLTRKVEILPDGIRTVTASSDPQVMAALVSHVVGMIGRVEAKDDPQIFVQSPTLDIFFARSEALVSDIAVTEAGIVVTQTSDDPDLVAALHQHAGEVSAMAERGMVALHEMMMQRGGPERH